MNRGREKLKYIYFKINSVLLIHAYTCWVPCCSITGGRACERVHILAGFPVVLFVLLLAGGLLSVTSAA